MRLQRDVAEILEAEDPELVRVIEDARHRQRHRVAAGAPRRRRAASRSRSARRAAPAQSTASLSQQHAEVAPIGRVAGQRQHLASRASTSAVDRYCSIGLRGSHGRNRRRNDRYERQSEQPLGVAPSPAVITARRRVAARRQEPSHRQSRRNGEGAPRPTVTASQRTESIECASAATRVPSPQSKARRLALAMQRHVVAGSRRRADVVELGAARRTPARSGRAAMSVG